MLNSQQVSEFQDSAASGGISKLHDKWPASHPADIAAFLSKLKNAEQVWSELAVCEPTLRAEIFSHLNVDLQVELSEFLSRDDLTDLLRQMSPDDRVDFFQQLPAQRRETVLGAMARAEREDIRKLASYDEGTTGAAMTSDYVSLPPGITAREAIAKLRLEAPNKETIYYSYIVDGLHRLVGFVSLKDLILANPETQIADIMHREVVCANVTDDQEDASRLIRKYDLIALPVVNGNRVLVGILTHDDAIDIIVQEQTEDIEKLMGIQGPHEPGMYLRTSAWEHFRKRVVWIVILAALGFISGFIVQSFEGLLMQFAILATFMPMLADTGGNTGSQSATLVVRALALREIRPSDVLRVLLKEVQVALPLGIVLSVMAFFRVILFTEGSTFPPETSIFFVGAAIAIALGLQVTSATLIGALLPLIVAYFRKDPAVVASPALTTIVDITGLLIFFTTVKLML